ncbi:glycosyltransferase [Microbacterium gorillae]|uniref:glycosyltransferase n=1 Tax=Microbacterium gorillae TaxID=1231063 RepID=UPI00058FDAAB|nr:glycosyltransferase [Microbacterium gorillae]
MTRLVLFTNDYPYATGDVVFVDKEIDALAARFDDVVVFCHARDTSAGRVPMPANVTLGGNLFERSADDSLFAPLHPRMLGLLAQAAWRELIAGRLLSHVRLFLMGARVGITQARRPAVRAAIAGDRDTVAYAFWGMGGGLGLAWLTGVRGRAVRLHRYDLYEDRAPGGYLPFRRQLFARADRVMAISDDGARSLTQNYRDRKLDAKTVVSRLGVPGPVELNRPVPSTERVVVSCSAITPIKRVDLILDALRALPDLDADHPVRWVHFGSGPLAAELAASATDLPVGLTVDLRGQTPNADIAAFYASTRVDAFVNASTSEGIPVSIMEAIAYDIPVVATAVGGTPEIVGVELGSGELVAADASATTFAQVIGRVLTNPDAYHPRELWQREYDVARTGQIAATIVHDLLPKKAKS